jgi:hypothetical protein
METTLKMIIKEAILEALAEYSNYGVAVANDIEASLDEGKDKDKNKTPGRPGPLIGPSGFSLR